MDPDKVNLKDLMDQPDIIDLSTFDPLSEKVADEKPVEVPGLDELKAQVRELQKTFEMAQKTSPVPPPEAKPKEEKTWERPTAPSDEDIQEMLKDGKTFEAFRAMQMQYAVNNFLPAIEKLSENVRSEGAEVGKKSDQALASIAARAIQDKVSAIPALTPYRDEVYEMFRGATPEQILAPGVIDNIIYTYIGKKASRGEWVGGTHLPPNIPAGSAGPSDEAADLDPRMVDIFKKITGVSNADVNVINTLRRPHAISIGRGEG